MVPHVGNDVVDLAGLEGLPRARFVERICVPSERRLLGPSDVQLFWTLFAAKEAAFKALKKSLSELAFVPRDFVVHETLASVRHGTTRFALTVEVAAEWVHVIAHPDGASVAARLTLLRENESESEGARRLLRELAAVDVVREPDEGAWDGYGPPRAYAGSVPAPFDVSLSHDGRFAACALLAWCARGER